MTGAPRPQLAAALVAGAVLAGCSDGADTPAASSSSSASASSAAASSSDTGTDLAPGLLPAAAFGADAQVTPVTEQQLAQGATAAGGSLDGLTVTPESCAAAVRGTQPQLDQFDDVAAQVAVRGTTTTAQLLSSGGPVADVVAGVAEGIAGCPQAEISSPEIGSVTISFAGLDVPDLGDEAAGLSFTTVAAAADGRQVTVPALLGVVRDGDRLLTLLTTDPQGGTVDPAAFTALLEQAYDVQAAALD